MENEYQKRNEYRISFIVKEEDAASVRAVILAEGGEITKEQPLVKMRLAYPVKREYLGFAGTAVFTAAPDAIAKMKSALSLNAAVLRAMITADVPQEEEKRDQGFSPSGSRTARSRRPVRSEAFGAQLSNEALEKKIEEISQ